MKSVLLLLAERRYLAQQVVCSFYHKNHGPPQFSGVHLSLPLLLFPFFSPNVEPTHKVTKGMIFNKWSLKKNPPRYSETHTSILQFDCIIR